MSLRETISASSKNKMIKKMKNTKMWSQKQTDHVKNGEGKVTISCHQLQGKRVFFFFNSLLFINYFIFKLKLFILYWGITNQGLPQWLNSKESACNARDPGSIPGSVRSPGGGHGNPLQYSSLENPQGQRSPAGCSPQGCTESDTTEATKQHQLH